MKRRPLFWKVYPYYLLVIIASVVLAAYFGARQMEELYTNQVATTLEAQARLVVPQLRPWLDTTNYSQLGAICRTVSEASGARFTVVDADGLVLSDSHQDRLLMENHGTRPEIADAYRGAVGVRTRYSNTLQTSMMYVAVPIEDSGQVIAVVRAAVPVAEVETVLASFYQTMAAVGAVIALLAALISVILVRRFTRPLHELSVAAGRYAAGELDTRLPIPGTREIGDLSESMNQMAEQLDVRFRTIMQQRNESDAILSSMSEGVMALDAHQRVVSLNRVAAEFFALNIEHTLGRSVHEGIRSTALFEFIEAGMQADETVVAEIDLQASTGRTLQAHASALRDSAGERVGLVLVFNDISKLKRLETMRRDFVANVSHELKTPITAIKGAVETLLNSDLGSIQDHQRFLDMIARHSERLNELVNDLLSLARLDGESESLGIKLSPGLIEPRIRTALEASEALLERKQISVSVDCEPGLSAQLSPIHFEQAILNLVDNAVKYSSEGSEVVIRAWQVSDEIIVSVIDQGPGIAEEHLPRLFERFYRVDPARSREVGGTGLGLAIVKHIALAHHGQVSVQSQLGQGSTFRIHLPFNK